MYRAFYATDIQAKKWGYTITKRATISREEAKKLRDYYDALEKGSSYSLGILAALIGGIFNGVVALAFGISYNTGAELIEELLYDLDDKFDILATSRENISAVEYTFQYRRHGSGGGAYFLKDVKIV